MSKLQLLAQKRKQLATSETSILPDALPPKSNGLSKLIQKRNSILSQEETSKPNSLLSLLSKKKQLDQTCKKEKTKKDQLIKDDEHPITNNIPDKSLESPDNTIRNTDIYIENINQLNNAAESNIFEIQSKPTHILSQILFTKFEHDDDDDDDINNDTPNPKRRKMQDNSYMTFINTNNHSFIKIPDNLAQKITKTFTSPSPDDKRKVVESLSEKVSKVSIDQAKAASSKKELTATKPKSKINIEKELEIKAEKPLLSFIVIGHVDSGKSTTIGRLLYDLGIVDSRTLHKLTRDAELAGKGSFSLAWVMDQTPEERSRGVTVDIVQTQFETSNMRFAVIDSPGHRDYVPQMINGITQADVAVVIIDSTSDLIFEATKNISNSVSSDASQSEIAKGQTFEQLTIAKNLGIENVLIVVNKMDSIDWDQERYELIKNSLISHLVENLDFSSENLEFIPASGFKGDNIVKKSEKCKWYNEGTLLQHLEKLNIKTHKSIEELTLDSKDPFVLTITDITNASGSDTNKKSDQIIIHGRINSGILQPGETLKLWPSGETGQVDSVTTNISQTGDLAKQKNNVPGSNIKLNEKIAVAGEFVEIKLRKIELSDAICIGDIATKVTLNNTPNVNISCGQKVECKLRMFGLTRPVLVGTPFVLFRGNVSYAAKLSSIEWVETRIVNDDGSVKLKKNKKRKHLSSLQRAKVIIETEKMIPLVSLSNEEKASENADGLRGLDKLKRIVLRKEGMTVGAGQII